MNEVIKIVSWNIGQRANAWKILLDSSIDIALLQEAKPPPPSVRDRINSIDDLPWRTGGHASGRDWRTCIASFSDKIRLCYRPIASIDVTTQGQLAVSRMGTLSVADLELSTGDTITLVSMYGAWETPVTARENPWIYADASVHRLISDLSALIAQQRGHRIIAAGDLNILRDYGENGSSYWKARYDTVFSRMTALGLQFVGPQAPHGRQASPWPKELPPESQNVPTYHTRSQGVANATRQLDFVFASDNLRERIQVRALNAVEEWGLSDHCRVLIELQT
jgi:exonuclease III